TRSYGDWSSDVCSSDLLSEAAGRLGSPTEFVGYQGLEADTVIGALVGPDGPLEVAHEGQPVRALLPVTPFYAEGGGQIGDVGTRSEERRVGKEGRARGG